MISRVPKREYRLDIDIAQFPSLQTLDLHENDLNLSVSDELAKVIQDVRLTDLREPDDPFLPLPPFPFTLWDKIAPYLRQFTTTANLWSSEYPKSSRLPVLGKLNVMWIDTVKGSPSMGVQTIDGPTEALENLYLFIASSRAPQLRHIMLYSTPAISITDIKSRWETDSDGSASFIHIPTFSPSRVSERRQHALARLKAICAETNVAIEEAIFSESSVLVPSAATLVL